MRRPTFLRSRWPASLLTSAVLTFVASRATSEEPKPQKVGGWDLKGYSFEKMQAGDWVEYLEISSNNGKEGDPVFLRLACVKRGKSALRIEKNEGGKSRQSSRTIFSRATTLPPTFQRTK